jgi:hypothetical protein
VPTDKVLPRDVDEWLRDAVADAERRGLPDLKPLLENLAQSTALLRAADWNDDASGTARK